MSMLSSCQRCRGFVPPSLTECVHCGAPMREPAPREGRLLKGLVGLAGAGVAAITLMACYGAAPFPPCETPAPDGGSDPYWCLGTKPWEDGGVLDDGGTQTPDGGSDAGR